MGKRKEEAWTFKLSVRQYLPDVCCVWCVRFGVKIRWGTRWASLLPQQNLESTRGDRYCTAS